MSETKQTLLIEPTQAQIYCIRALCAERNLKEEDYTPKDKRDASRIIDELKALPRGESVSRFAKPKPTIGKESEDAFALATRLVAEKLRAQNVPVAFDQSFWKAVRQLFIDFEREKRMALSYAALRATA